MEILTKFKEINIITLGDGKVGKSSFIVRYMDDRFSSNYLSTIGIDLKVKNIKTSNGDEVRLKIYDTVGQERYKSIAENYIKRADGIIFVYDITEESSFYSIKNWIKSVDNGNQNHLPYIIVGNKSDLEEDRVISKEKGEKLAKSFNIEGHFYETSCSNGDNIKEAVNDIVEQVYSIIKDRKSVQNIKLLTKEKPKKNCCKS